jgi:hypothetical protein
MGCNCGSKANTNKWIFTDPQGKRVEYTSEVQAQAAKIRANGGSIQKVTG